MITGWDWFSPSSMSSVDDKSSRGVPSLTTADQASLAEMGVEAGIYAGAPAESIASATRSPDTR